MAGLRLYETMLAVGRAVDQVSDAGALAVPLAKILYGTRRSFPYFLKQAETPFVMVLPRTFRLDEEISGDEPQWDHTFQILYGDDPNKNKAASGQNPDRCAEFVRRLTLLATALNGRKTVTTDGELVPPDASDYIEGAWIESMEVDSSEDDLLQDAGFPTIMVGVLTWHVRIFVRSA